MGVTTGLPIRSIDVTMIEVVVVWPSPELQGWSSPDRHLTHPNPVPSKATAQRCPAFMLNK